MPDVRKTSSSSPARGVVYDFSGSSATRTARVERAPETDSAAVTESARELSRAHGAVEASSDIRTEKVKTIQAQLRNGAYKPDPRDVAKAILERGF